MPLDIILTRIPADGRRPLANDRVQMAMRMRTAGSRISRPNCARRLRAHGRAVEQLIEQLEKTRYLTLTDIHSNLEALTRCPRVGCAATMQCWCLAIWWDTGPIPTLSSIASAILARAIVRGNRDKVASGLDNAELQSDGQPARWTATLTPRI